MILKSLNLDTVSLKTTVADVPQWGEGAQVTLTEMTVKGKVRQSKLHQQIQNRNVDDDEKTALFMCANLMCVMVDPDNGEFLLQEAQLDQFRKSVSGDTLSSLLVANNEVNPVIMSPDTLASKKKKR